MDTPGIMRDESGPVASPELFVIVGPSDQDGRERRQRPAARRVAAALKVHPQRQDRRRTHVHARHQRNHRRPRRVAQFAGLTVGTTHQCGAEHVAGRRDLRRRGGVSESEIWCDAKVLQPAYRRGNSYQSVYVRLAIADAFRQLQGRAHDEPADLGHRHSRARLLRVAVRDRCSGSSGRLAFIIAGSDGHGRGLRRREHDVQRRRHRTREIATLRALGFGSVPVVSRC